MNWIPPILSANELRKLPKQATSAWEASGIVRPADAATSVACADCGSLRRVQIEIDVDKVGHGYISCPECGIAEVDLAALRRWAIDPEQLLVAIFQSAATVALTELVPQRLWRIGKAAWGGRPRELLFALCKRHDVEDAVRNVLKKRPKSVLFVPTEPDAASWSDEVSNKVVALESVAFIQGATFAMDGVYLESLLSAGEPAAASPAKQKTRRRSPRTAKIEALKKVMIEHLRAARDHAVSTRDLTGGAELLPCPSKEAFGSQAGLKPYDVTRCFQDQAGEDLHTLWNLAHDLDRILAYRS